MLNSEEVETLNKYHQIINNQFNIYNDYINNVIDKKQKFNFLFRQSMTEFYTSILNANINEKYNDYCAYILDKLRELPIHNQYIRKLKLKKINELNDTKN